MNGKKIRFCIFNFDQGLFREPLPTHLVEALVEDRLLPGDALAKIIQLRDTWENGNGAYTPYAQALTSELGQSIGGVRKTDLMRLASRVINKHGTRTLAFTRELRNSLKSVGIKAIALSHLPDEVVHVFQPEWQFEGIMGIEYDVDTHTNTFIGNQPVLPLWDKARMAQKVLARHDDSFGDGREGIAIGSELSDLELLRSVTWPIAYNPDQALEREARALGIPVVKELKDTIVVMRADANLHIPFEEPSTRTFHEVPLARILPESLAKILRARLNLQRFNLP
jgi:phosphoserine phosphatase